MAIELEPKITDPTRRETLGDFVEEKPAGYADSPQVETLSPVEHVLIEDRPEHAHMFPPNGIHAPGVPRYPSGFRNWHDVEPKK